MTWLLEEVLGRVFGLLLFTTGELLLFLGTFGRHRVRWWEGSGELLEGRGTWLSWILGIAFWLALAGALARWVF